MRCVISISSVRTLCGLAKYVTPPSERRMTSKCHKIRDMTKAVQTILSAWALILTSTVFAEPYVYPAVHLHDLPSALQEAYRNEKPNLGDIGRCVVSYDNNMDQEKMIFTCSIYVKMSAVAERKAMERCEQMKEKRGIKGPCKVIKE